MGDAIKQLVTGKGLYRTVLPSSVILANHWLPLVVTYLHFLSEEGTSILQPEYVTVLILFLFRQIFTRIASGHRNRCAAF